MDATVSWGGPDYKFKNSTAYPIKICARRSGAISQLSVGNQNNNTYVKMEYEINETYPSGTIYTEDISVPKGTKE